MKVISHYTLYIYLVLCCLMAVMPVVAQDEEDPLTNDAVVYVCVIKADGQLNLIEFQNTQPIALIFAQPVNITVFSTATRDIVLDLWHVLPDTASGAYRVHDLRGTVASDIYTTENVAVQDTCTSSYSKLQGLQRTIPLATLPDQAITIRNTTDEIPYFTEDSVTDSLTVGAIGLVFLDNSENPVPNFQLLRFAVGNPNDTVSIAFPDIQQDTNLYAVSRQRVSLITIDGNGFETTSKLIDGRDRFVSRLSTLGNGLRSDVMEPGNIRMYVEFGENLLYETGGQLQFTRPRAFIPRPFEVGQSVEPISCAESLLALAGYNPFNVAYFRSGDYVPSVYFQPNPPSVGSANCENDTTIEEVRPDGVLVVNGGFQIAAWLVQPK